MEMALWRAEGGKLRNIAPSAMRLEAELETLIESDSSVLGEDLLIIGRQVATPFGGVVDLLALDETGVLYVIELKRDRTPRDVTGQALDYWSWAATLALPALQEIFAGYRPAVALEEAFADRFNDILPGEVNASQVVTIVAASVDAATERIIRFLNEDLGLPINVVFFRQFADGDAYYLGRSWLVDGHAGIAGAGRTAAGKAKAREPWNGTDWYVSFGEEPGGRQWTDGREYGFVSAGGAEWSSRRLKNLPVGARIFALIPKNGYVGVGTVMGEARRFDQTEVMANGVLTPLAELALVGDYRHDGDHEDDLAEWVVPVEWTHTVPREEAFWRNGMYANQNTATKLRQRFTINQVSREFELGD